MKILVKLFLLAYLACRFPSFIIADTYILKTGEKIIGDLVTETNSFYIITTTDKGEISIPKKEVTNVLHEKSTQQKIDSIDIKEIPLEDMVDKLMSDYKISKKTQLPTIAIIPFHASNQKLNELDIGVGIAELISDYMVSRWISDFQIVERSKIQEALSEQALGLTGIISETSAIKVGKLLQADTLLLGSVSEIDKNYLISSRIVNTQTGEIISAQSIKIPIKKVHEEAESYINLPKNRGFYFKMVYLGLEPIENSVVLSDGRELINNTDFSSWSGFVMGFRRFFSKSLLGDFGFFGNPLGAAEHTLIIRDGTQVEDHVLEKKRIRFNFWLSLCKVKETEKGLFFIGPGVAILNVDVAREGKPSLSNLGLTTYPLLKAGYEWRVRERIGISIDAQYLFNTKEITGDPGFDDNITDFKFFKINPLSFSVSTGFYF